MSFTKTIQNYLSLVKFSHTIFALPFALIGFFLAKDNHNQNFNIQLFVCVILCMVFARSAAMAFNRWLDKEFDAKNKRTAIREIPAGIISSKSALFFTIITSLLFVATTFFINRLCFYLSPVALIVVLGYSFTKRFTPLCHLVLGVGLSLAPIGAYIAITERFELQPLFFSAIVFFWVSAFDIIYALQDEEFDRANQLKSIPVLLGKKNALRFSELMHLVCAALVVGVGIYSHFGFIYWIGAAAFMCLLVYQHSIVKPNDLSRVNLAFGTTNGIASIIYCVFTCIEILK